jgi:DNA-binding NtrC family response regulator
MKRILVIEDESLIRRQLVRLLTKHGYVVDESGSVPDAERLGLDRYDLIIADVRLPGVQGSEMIERARPIPVLIMSSYASIRSAVECMQRGAVDYIAKPFDHDELLLTVQRVLQKELAERQQAALKSTVERDYPSGGIIGDCVAMRNVMERVRRIAAADVTVLISGESGTGKELVARAIHTCSPRSAGPFVAINCAAIAETLIEAELFGYEKGAFTGATARKAGLFEAAHGGTLFLDEVAELAPATQARLLRVLQEGEVRPVGATQMRRVDVRVLAATHRDLESLVKEERFRSDLYYRIKVTDIDLPPLRERGNDIEQLAEYFLRQSRQRLARPNVSLGEDARLALRAYRWPGNVRELANAIERAVILCDDDCVRAEELALPSSTINPVKPVFPATGDVSLDRYFRDFVLSHQNELSETELAKRLGISRKTLWERRQKMGLPRKAEENGQ